MSEEIESYKLSDKDLSKLIDNLDETGGYLIKESELRYWVEKFVNEDRERRSHDNRKSQ